MKILHHALNTAQRHVFSRKFYIHLWKANFVIGCDRREANAIITLGSSGDILAVPLRVL